MSDTVAELIKQGGFASLAGFMAFMGWRSHQDAQKLLSRTLDVLAEAAAAKAALTVAVTNMGTTISNEVAGLRAGIHGLRELMATFEARQYETDQRLKAIEPKRRPA